MRIPMKLITVSIIIFIHRITGYFGLLKMFACLVSILDVNENIKSIMGCEYWQLLPLGVLN